MRGKTTTLTAYPGSRVGGSTRGSLGNLLRLGAIDEARVEAAERRREKAQQYQQDVQLRRDEERQRRDALQVAIEAAERGEKIRQELLAHSDIYLGQVLRAVGIIAGLALGTYAVVAVATRDRPKAGRSSRRSRSKRRRRMTRTIQTFHRSSAPAVTS